MDKIFSARVDESIIHLVTSLAARLRTSKKKILERAVQMYADKIDEQENQDVFERSFGSWRRNESAGQISEKSRKKFREAMERHQS